MMMNENLEYMVIGSIVKYPELLSDLVLKPEMFYDPYSTRFFSFIEKNNGMNLAALYQAAKKHEVDFIPSALIEQWRNDDLLFKSHFTQYQIEVMEVFKAKTLSDASIQYSNNPTKENRQHLNEVMQYVNSLEVSKRDSKKEVIGEIIKELSGEVKPSLIKTGYSQLDNLIGGWEPGQLVVVGARPSTGKTAFALNLALKLADKGSHVSLFSLETTNKKITQRILATMSRVHLNKFKTPDAFTDDEQDKLAESLEKYKDMSLVVHDNDHVTPSMISREASRMKQTSKNNVIIIDYLTLMMSDGKHRDRRLEVEEISRKLKIIAKEQKCVIIALSQLNRGVESRTEKRPVMSDLREAGGIEQDADMVFLLYRDDYYNRTKEPDAFGKSDIECIIAKSKDSATGTALFSFYKTTGGFF
ncbi:replicative DNA helicase [Macrococcus equipercicus]|uniref:AAA family ATPase n=1 Tax=Macrococcus equipercicus TaxID=69967 RepID=A0A9Q9F0J1_9STAP|nr:replicative DNA helicase [Macrococcus equipercicus]UTH13018.1 AAA family ATPase [Macrococcus equipercicus]